MVKVKTDAIIKWKKPNNLKELRSFLRLYSYYRKFIKGFAIIVDQLNKLNRIYNSLGENRVGTFKSCNFKIGWNLKCEEAMSILKYRLISASMLGIAKFNVPFILETDVSNINGGL